MASPRRKPDFLEQAIPWLQTATMAQAVAFYDHALHDKSCTDAVVAGLGRGDRFFLFTHILSRFDAIHPWIYERCREVEASPDDHLDLWARGHYKDQALDTPTYTPKGWLRHGDIDVGDHVFAPNGKPVRVLATSKVFEDSDTYRITLRNGDSFVVGAGHLWDFQTIDRRRDCRGRVTLLRGTTLDMLRRCELYHPVRLNIHEPLNFDDADLQVLPYTLGAWLGDGAKDTAFISGIDDPVFQAVESEGYMVKRRHRGGYVYDLLPSLRALGVLGNKHIPEIYMRSSVEQRRQLLQGLMDTDGHMHISDGKAVFVQIPGRLCDDVETLVRGLGYDVRRYQYANDHQGVVQLHWKADRHTFRLERKLDGVLNNTDRRGNGYVIDDIVKCQPTETRCIQVEGGRYLTGRTMAPTHNSSIITFAGCIQEIIRDPEVTIGIFSHTRPIAKAFLRQIKRELEHNTLLKRLYPDCLYAEPGRESPMWSEESGIVVRRKSNPKEATVEAWGLVDGQPTSKHFKLRVYDDVVTRESVTTGEQILKTTEGYELSLNLSSRPPRQWLIGTRYNFADTYKTMLDRGVVKPRVYAATDDGTPDGKPVFLGQAEWDKKKQEMGPYVTACHVRGSSVLMADWTYKNIEDVRPGDVVVGINTSSPRSSLVPTKVIATRSRISIANRYRLKSGSFVECTPDHLWWTGRRGKNRKAYSALGNLGYGNIRGLVRVAWNEPCPDQQAAAWLSGMIDGEGTVTARGMRVMITQSEEHNPEVVARLRSVMSSLDIPFSEYFRAGRQGHKSAIHFSLNGGRPTRHKLLLWYPPAKRKKIIASMFGSLGRFSPADLDKVESIEKMGEQEVFTLQTESGNYVANGYASKNCQMLQNPVAGSEQDLQPEWIRTYDVRPMTLNVYIMGDPADSKEKGTSNTAFAVVGVDANMNKYLLDGACHKMNLKERWIMLKGLHKKWSISPGVQQVKVGYEKYGMQADIQHFEQQMELENYAFPINEVSWTRDGINVKDDRIRRLVPDLSSWRFFWPYQGEETSSQRKYHNRGQDFLLSRPIKRKNHEGRIYNLVEWVVANEYTLFPATTQKDFLDALSRIYDLEPRGPVIYDERELAPTIEG